MPCFMFCFLYASQQHGQKKHRHLAMHRGWWCLRPPGHIPWLMMWTPYWISHIFDIIWYYLINWCHHWSWPVSVKRCNFDEFRLVRPGSLVRREELDEEALEAGEWCMMQWYFQGSFSSEPRQELQWIAVLIALHFFVAKGFFVVHRCLQ